MKSPRMAVKICLTPEKALILKSCHSCLKEENLTTINIWDLIVSLSSHFFFFFVPKIWSTEKGNFNLDLRYVTAFEIKMRALNSMDNENLVYGYCWFQTMLSTWKKNSNASERIAFFCNKWLALNLIIFFATKTMGAFAARKKSMCASIRITDLFWSMPVLFYRNQCNERSHC